MHRATSTRRAAVIAPALLAAAGAVSMAVCNPGESPKPPTADPPVPRWGTVTLPSGATLSVEIADTPYLLQRGYMFRDRVPDGEGMVFFMGQLDIHPFWMKNCRTALDILWLDDRWRIVHIAPNVPPCKDDPCPTYTPLQKSLYVLEVGPNGAARLGLKVGDQISFIPPAASSK